MKNWYCCQSKMENKPKNTTDFTNHGRLSIWPWKSQTLVSQWLTLWRRWFTGITCHNSLTLFTSQSLNPLTQKMFNISQWTRTAKTNSREVKSLTFVFCLVVELRYLALLVTPVKRSLWKPRSLCFCQLWQYLILRNHMLPFKWWYMARFYWCRTHNKRLWRM